MKNILFLDSHTLPTKSLEFDFPCSYQGLEGKWAGNPALGSANVIITNKVRLDDNFMAGLPGLEMIAVAATGYDHVDVESARRRGITVCNVPDYSSVSVSELVLAMMLSLTNHLPEYASSSLDGRWCASDHFSVVAGSRRELAGKKIAIVGRGNTGKAVGRLSQAFGMEVLFCERKSSPTCRPGYVPFYAGIAAADFVSLHCPASPAQNSMIGEDELAMMKSTAILINVGRGQLVDPVALADALLAHKIFGAAMDVLESEPPGCDHVLLTGIPNLIVTPHIAWRTIESEERLVGVLKNNIGSYFRGEPMNVL